MHRRMDPEVTRREPREHDIPRVAGNSGRFSRKRPSMLSEFHGNKFHNHNSREGDRDGDIQHYRSHNRYLHDSPGGLAAAEHPHSFPSSAFHSKLSKSDSRSRHVYHHGQHRSMPHYHYNSHHYMNSDAVNEEEVPVKRPRLMMDVTGKALNRVDQLNSTDSLNSSPGGGEMGNMDSPGIASPTASAGLSAYHLEDIDSDDDDSFLREENDKKLSKSPTPVPVESPIPMPKTRKGGSPATLGMPSKEELLMMMDKVDRDIAAVETQISALQKKQAELEETAKAIASTPHSGMSISSSVQSPSRPSSRSDLGEDQEGEDSGTLVTPPPPSPKKSQIDTIYSENRSKARSARAILSTLNFPPVPGPSALYHQPCDAPSYQANINTHQELRTGLVRWVLERKLMKHEKEMELCEEFDSQLAKWEKSVERIENNPKKRIRDQRNRELFEKYFPELKTKREQLERMTRVDQRGYGIARSDAEMKEIMFELYERAEAPVRHRRTHAAVPPMLDESERRMQFENKNGHIADPMALHRESCFIYMWSEEEKATFRDKYMFNPKDFETISSFLPNKSPADCVLYYYLSKKREKFKHLVRKANFKRKKAYVKPPDYITTSLGHSSLHHTLPLSIFASAKPKPEVIASPEQDREKDPLFQSEYGDWTSEEIDLLKEGLHKYGRAWGKIYRVVGGRKTATQCKQFYDKFCMDSKLELSVALAKHSSMKNAEKLRRKADSHKPESSVMAEAENSQPVHRNPSSDEQVGDQDGATEEMDSENTESAYETESKSDESGSESTITDSCPEDSSANMPLSSSVQLKPLRGTKKSKPISGSSSTSSGFKRSSEEALDLFISAAEALNNIVPPEVALHDHNYSLPPSSLASSMDGLSLIAAAAAVVSPTLSRSTGGNKVPSLSPVRAPRGRPPNSQRKGSSSTASKLAPTLLSPAGTSNSVLLTDMKAGPLRGRTRSAPSDRPKCTLHVPRPSSLARMSINSNNRRGGSSAGLIPPASYTKHKTDSTSTPSLKSMIAFQPPSSSSSQNSTGISTSGSTSNSISAFEALVNVAVAAHPAELPQSSMSGSLQLTSSQVTAVSKLSSFSVASPSSTLSFTATNLPSSQPAVTLAVTTANSNASNSTGTTTAFLDINQTINLLVSLAQQPVASGNSNNTSQPISMLPAQRILAPVNLLGNIVMQGSKANSTNGGNLVSSTLPTSKGPKTLSSALSDTLLSHLTSNINSQANSGKSVPVKGVGMKGKKVAVSKSEGSLSRSNSVSSGSTSREHNGKGSAVSSAASTPTGTKTGEDMSNLDLLSSFVAAVAASSQAPAGLPSTVSLSPGTSSTPTATVGHSSNIHSSVTELKRFSDNGAAVASSSASGQKALATSTPPLLSNSSSCAGTPTSDESSVSSPSCSKKQLQQKDQKVMLNVDSSNSVKASGHSSSSALVSPDAELLDAADNLPRSVVRSVMGCSATNSEDHTPSPIRQRPAGASNVSPSSSAESDMTASLASIIPSYSPSVGNQSVLLYTRSLSFPMSSEPSTEEEDHLASATRGISELSKLLGTDTDAGSRTRQDSPIYKDTTGRWNPSDLLNSTSAARKSVANNSEEFISESPENSGSFLSSVLESQIHGTVHHTSLPTSLLNSTPTNSNVTDNAESTLDMDHSR